MYVFIYIGFVKILINFEFLHKVLLGYNNKRFFVKLEFVYSLCDFMGIGMIFKY